ncbi:prolyl oligopeptidase family serine peptidase [Xanthomonas axonopodis pv. vasculorum]|uniref:Peptidase n=2 Tax=Xanthomonas axonopodis TaxID=53413 RepID=A0A098Q2I4_9XANT|nr:prolyl oligopeptidase family serine peptidase [Xanthomonas axonopodis]KGE53574.1 peptidase [Xanthomonas axonopodis pv. vasculorum]PPV07912.1 S9 family peptidase [Xanthomonas axonopodis pv. vasculorum]QKD88223.1 S9 family peptidase [Xanthomonas axonopodis pv. vasculorum]
MVASHRWTALFVLVSLMPLPAFAGTLEGGYRQPPEPLLSVMRAPLNPSPRPDPTGTTLLLVQRTQYPPIARVAEPYLKLAGVRVEPRMHSRHDMSNGYGIRSCLQGFSLVDIATGKQTAVSLPAGACPASPVWSPDGRRFAFNNTAADRVELWVGEVASGRVRKIDDVQLNPVLGGEIQWLGGSDTLLLKTVPQDLGPAPRKAAVPPGPEVKETIQGKGESSTYEARDTLSSPEDEALFTYYAIAQLLTVDVVTGSQRKLGAPAVYSNVEGAPDGRHVLVERLKQPYSYVTTYARFAHDVAVLDLETGNERVLANLPVADRVPVQGVPTGPRAYAWRANQPATLVWAEALDGGDWKTNVPARDRLMTLAAPFTAKPRELARVQQRYAGLSWFASGGQALLDEYDENRHWRRTTLVDTDHPGAGERVLFGLSTDDLYADPGLPEMRVLTNGQAVLREAQGALFLSGQGASPAGDRPFLDRYALATGKSQRLFRSDATVDEVFFGFAGDDASRLLTWHQSLTDPPNVYLRTLGQPLPAPAAGEAAFASTATPVTHFPDPTPLVRQIKKRLVSYKRKDGVDLSFTLYTPPGYKQGTRVPAILYAYPLDYADPSKAGQVSGASERDFTRLNYYQLLLLAGYAIIDDAAFPIVGDPKTAYDTYLQQLVDDATAAVDKAVELGVVDRQRIGVTGHSHGALMTANLLAHTDLFRAGAATSGSYNKTLTPFGFQNERRSFWTAPDVYAQASAFFHADKINEPLLIVHGMDDANPGTETTQAPRLFQAIRGNGGTARLVLLPFEPHWYTARESNEDLVAEMLEWFDRYVKNAPPRATGSTPKM